MSNLSNRLGAFAIVIGSIVAVPNMAMAAKITIAFAGTGNGAYEGKSFSGYLVYDSAKTGTYGVFNFSGSTVQHEIHYEGDSIPTTTVKQLDCEPFQIITNTNTNKLLKVNATAPAEAAAQATTILVTLPTAVVIYRTLPPLLTLPTCVQGTANTKVFIAAPAVGTAAFSLTGGTNFTGDITSVICNMN